MRAFSHPMQLVMGLVIWAVWFVVLYGLQGIGCSIAPPPAEQGALTWINAVLLGLGLGVTLLLVVIAYRCWKAGPRDGSGEDGQSNFVRRISAGIYLLSAISAAAVTLPVVIYPPCL